jgi:hypothetical protein
MTCEILWVAVSSRPHAEKDSYDQQIADGIAYCEQHGYSIVYIPVVPGHSREYLGIWCG